MGSSPHTVPGGVLRWYVAEGPKLFMIHASTSGGRVTSKGSSEIEEVR